MHEVYMDFFGFDVKPFNVTPDPDFLYYSEQHKEALAHMMYGVEERKGFVLVSGRVGSGKTTLCRAFLRELDDSTRTALVLNTTMNFHELLTTIAEDFGLELSGEPSKKQLLDKLNEFVLEEYRNDRNVCLVIDEAQNLSPEVLENLRLLSNLETDKEKLFQIVLVGQPELNSVLAMDRLRQLKQRVAVRCHLSNLDREETGEYVLHRLKTAEPDAQINVDPEVFDDLYRVSKGNPRVINLICDRMLMAAFVDETRTITSQQLHQAAEDLLEENRDEITNIPGSRTERRLNKLIQPAGFEQIHSTGWWTRAAVALVFVLLTGLAGAWLSSVYLNPVKPVISSNPEAGKGGRSTENTARETELDNREVARNNSNSTAAEDLINVIRADSGVAPAKSKLLCLSRLVSHQVSDFDTFPVVDTGVKLPATDSSSYEDILSGVLDWNSLDLESSYSFFEQLDYPFLLEWNDEAGRRYVLKVPGREGLWDPVRGWLKPGRDEIVETWSGRGELILKPPPGLDPGDLYKMGREGPDVKRLQQLLKQTVAETLPTTGFYGDLTGEATVVFQDEMGLPTDGILGPKTIVLLLDETDSSRPKLKRSELQEFTRRLTKKDVLD